MSTRLQKLPSVMLRLAACAAVALAGSVMYVSVLRRASLSDDVCQRIYVHFEQALPHDGKHMKWDIEIVPIKGTWAFEGTRQLSPFMKIPEGICSGSQEVGSADEMVLMSGRIRLEACNTIIRQILEYQSDLIGRGLEAVSTRYSHMPTIRVVMELDGRSYSLVSTAGVTSDALERIAMCAVAITLLCDG